MASGALDPQAVLIDARRLAGGPVAAGHPDRRAGPLRPARTGPGRLRRTCCREHPVTGVSDTAALAAIGAAARELKLPTVRADAARLAEIAVRERQTHLATSPRSWPPRSTTAPAAAAPAASPKPVPAPQAAGRLQPRRHPRHRRHPRRPRGRRRGSTPASRSSLLGDSGTGKTHLLIGLGLAACEQGRRVRYATTAALVNELAEAADQRQLSRVVGRYGRLDLLLLDELGYVQLDPRGAELLFQIITEREERASIAIGTNLPFSEWGTVFPDPRLVAAIVDRVTFNAHILETGTQSYRLATSKTSQRRQPASRVQNS